MQCRAIILDGSERNRCRNIALKGRDLCYHHARKRVYLDFPDPLYAISLDFKPARRNADGSYRKTLIGKVFPSREKAESWALLCGDMIFNQRKPGERVCSYSVIRIAGPRRTEDGR